MKKVSDAPILQTRAVDLQRIADAVTVLQSGPTIDLPVIHRFTPGLYSRELRIPKGIKVITKVHLVEHQYVVPAGKLLVWSPGELAAVLVQAPHIGITKVGTVRLAIALEDSVWVTFHPTELTDVAEIEKEVVMEPAQAAILALQEEQEKWLLSQSRQE